MTMRTCLQCGWVHYGIARENALLEVERFTAFWNQAPDGTKAMFGNKSSSIEDYEHCCNCGGSYENFRESREGGCPAGCTISPIIAEPYSVADDVYAPARQRLIADDEKDAQP